MIVDPRVHDDNEETRATAADEAVTADPQNSESTAPAVTQDNESDIPEKFRGKSKKEVVGIYRDLETEVGRARNEIGTLRRLSDELLGLRREPAKSQPEAKPVTPHDLAERPEETIVQVATRVADQRVTTAEKRLAAIETTLQEKDLTVKHGDYKSTLASPEFMGFVQGSPYRIKLVQRAAQGDMEAGDEILSLYKETRPAPKPSDKQDQNLDAARKVETAKSGGSGANNVVNTDPAKKIWTRTELAKLYTDNPDEYNRRHDEIQQAYVEKRVR